MRHHDPAAPSCLETTSSYEGRFLGYQKVPQPLAPAAAVRDAKVGKLAELVAAVPSETGKGSDQDRHANRRARNPLHAPLRRAVVRCRLSFWARVGVRGRRTEQKLMRVSDLVLLGKKIGVGILITLIPLGILIGGLWFSQKLLKKNPQSTVNHSVEARNANRH
jgi:hypothetical protein